MGNILIYRNKIRAEEKDCVYSWISVKEKKVSTIHLIQRKIWYMNIIISQRTVQNVHTQCNENTTLRNSQFHFKYLWYYPPSNVIIKRTKLSTYWFICCIFTAIPRHVRSILSCSHSIDGRSDACTLILRKTNKQQTKKFSVMNIQSTALDLNLFGLLYKQWPFVTFIISKLINVVYNVHISALLHSAVFWRIIK